MLRITRTLLIVCTTFALSVANAAENSDAPSGPPTPENGEGQATVGGQNDASTPSGQYVYGRGPAPDWQGSSYADDMGYAVAAPFGPWITLDGRFGDGLGYDGSYYNVSVFNPRHIDPGFSLFFTMLNGSVTEHGDGVLNVGAGYGVYLPNYNRVFRASGWFDLDDGAANTHYRAGLSLESLGRYFDATINGYVVLGDDSNPISQVFVNNPFFQQNFILLTQRTTTQHAYGGTDFEIGGLVPFLGRRGIYGYVGGYYLGSSQDKDTMGMKVRAEVAVSDDITAGMTYTEDDVFGATTFASVAIQFPYRKQTNWFKPRCVRDRLAAPVRRQDRIPVHTKIVDAFIPAIDPNDGMPIFVNHVDPNLGPGGLGTFESPFGTLEAARLANIPVTDILRVLPRTDGTGTNLAMTAPLILNPFQRALSTTLPHTFTAVQGTFAFPGFTGFGAGPLISNAANTAGIASGVIRLAGRNEVRGFIIDGANSTSTDNGLGIVTPAVPTTSFSIRDNVFRNYTTAVSLTDVTGSGLFNRNFMTGAAGISTDGLVLRNTMTGTLNLLALSNTATGHSDTGIDITADGGGVAAPVINTDAAVVAGTGFSSNTTNANDTGAMFTAAGGGTINFGGSSNIASGNTGTDTGHNFLVTGTGSTLNIGSYASNVVTGNLAGNGVRMEATAGGLMTVAGVSGNAVTGNGLSNLFIRADGAGSTITGGIGGTALTRNSFNGALTGAGIRIESTMNSVIGAGAGTPFVISNNDIGTAASPNAGWGILAIADGDASAAGGAFDLNIGGASAAAGNSIVSDGATNNLGISVTLANSGVGADAYATTLGISNNTVTDTGSAGVSVAVTDDATMNAMPPVGTQIWTSNVVTGAGSVVTSPGMRVETSDTSTGNVHISSNTFSGNSGNGLELVARDTSTLNSIVNPTTITNNGLNGLLIRQLDAADMMATVTGNTITDHANGRGIFYDADGIVGGLGERAQMIGVFSGNTVTGNGLAGFEADMQGRMGTRAAGPGTDGASSITLTGNLFNNNGQEGVLFQTETRRQDRTVDFIDTGGAVVAVDPDTTTAEFGALADYLSDGTDGQYLNTATVLDVDFTMTGNQVRGNGTAGVAASDDGLAIVVGTGTNVQADIDGNTFGGGNAGFDVRIASQGPTDGDTPATIVGDFDGDTVVDDQRLTLDDTAQLDLRFVSNLSNDNFIFADLRVAGNAFFGTTDPGKDFMNVFTAPDAVDNRPAFLFQVSESALLTTNVFEISGVQQDIAGEFDDGRFNLETDPFPDAGFPDDQPLPAP
jgi:hypothetical protein